MGALNVDVANDSVDITQPKVDILPCAESAFRTVDTIERFLEVARVYWPGQFFPNTVFPRLAPVLPIIHVNPDGKVALKSGFAPIFAANFLNGCQHAHAYLARAKAERVVTPPAVVAVCLTRMGTDGWLAGACSIPDWERLDACFEDAADPSGSYWAPPSFTTMIRTVERVVKFQ
ncbi:MAG: hypothetical protein HC889_04365 [Synechococcaceae cyanobacterium SM1_2_3]|nr:hypothetical protein [Synechococcaceae cyanobacterium SM1_2_3]